MFQRFVTLSKNMDKINKCIKVLLIVLTIIYLAIYIFPLGAYDGGTYQDYCEDTEDFTSDRLYAAALVGVGTVFTMIEFTFVKAKAHKYSKVYVFIASLLQVVLAYFFRKIFLGINVHVSGYGDKLQENMTRMGVSLPVVIGIVNILIMCTIIINIVCMFINKKKQVNNRYEDEHRLEDEKVKVCLPDKLYDSRKKITKISKYIWKEIEILMILISIPLTLYPILGIIGGVLGYVVPIIVFRKMFLNEWLECGKWFQLFGIFMFLMYEIVVVLAFMCPTWVIISELIFSNLSPIILLIAILLVLEIPIIVVMVRVVVQCINERKYKM